MNEQDGVSTVHMMGHGSAGDRKEILLYLQHEVRGYYDKLSDLVTKRQML